ncbi:uncharacterized protein LOC128923035 [Zeugodacus cucurbitae]|uniref:uncharacterized protein LOC128923035 n=1 Tax=Zeugodacus cucurbitae TaxID=28588 RepID=UPI0023D93FE2|nr:uncharacterized protein LOC128923035 [Zeugodacus cucurbitae]
MLTKMERTYFVSPQGVFGRIPTVPFFVARRTMNNILTLFSCNLMSPSLKKSETHSIRSSFNIHALAVVFPLNYFRCIHVLVKRYNNVMIPQYKVLAANCTAGTIPITMDLRAPSSGLKNI